MKLSTVKLRLVFHVRLLDPNRYILFCEPVTADAKVLCLFFDSSVSVEIFWDLRD